MYQQPQSFSLAPITLKPGEPMKKWSRKQFQECQQKKWIHIEVDNWIEYNLEHESTKIQKWDVQKFALTFTDPKFKSTFTRDVPVPTILQIFLPIQFPVLKILHLQNHRIASIEPLARLKAPSLQIIGLNDNAISCLRSLRKSICPFTHIDLDSPLMVTANDLQEMNIIDYCSIEIRSSLKKLTPKNLFYDFIFNKNYSRLQVRGFPLKPPHIKYRTWIEDQTKQQLESDLYEEVHQKFNKIRTINHPRNYRINRRINATVNNARNHG